jgi:Na+/melibiose symporter-like transporter
VIGLLFFGWLSTKYGRKKIILFCNILLICGDIILILTNEENSIYLIIIGLFWSSMPHYVINILFLSLVP